MWFPSNIHSVHSKVEVECILWASWIQSNIFPPNPKPLLPFSFGDGTRQWVQTGQKYTTMLLVICRPSYQCRQCGKWKWVHVAFKLNNVGCAWRNWLSALYCTEQTSWGGNTGFTQYAITQSELHPHIPSYYSKVEPILGPPCYYSHLFITARLAKPPVIF